MRESLSGDLLHKLISDIIAVTEMLLSDGGPSYSMSVMDKVDKAVRARPGRVHKAHHRQTGQGDKGKKGAYIC